MQIGPYLAAESPPLPGAAKGGAAVGCHALQCGDALQQAVAGSQTVKVYCHSVKEATRNRLKQDRCGKNEENMEKLCELLRFFLVVTIFTVFQG